MVSYGVIWSPMVITFSVLWSHMVSYGSDFSVLLGLSGLAGFGLAGFSLAWFGLAGFGLAGSPLYAELYIIDIGARMNFSNSSLL